MRGTDDAVGTPSRLLRVVAVLVCSGVVLLPSVARAQGPITDRSLHLAPFVVMAAGQSADVLITARTFRAGCVEANVGAFGSARPTTARIVGIKAAALAAPVLVTLLLQKTGRQKAAHVTGLIVGGIGFSAAGYNLTVRCGR